MWRFAVSRIIIRQTVAYEIHASQKLLQTDKLDCTTVQSHRITTCQNQHEIDPIGF